jgi:hypothetical protein
VDGQSLCIDHLLAGICIDLVRFDSDDENGIKGFWLELFPSLVHDFDRLEVIVEVTMRFIANNGRLIGANQVSAQGLFVRFTRYFNF